MSDLLLKALFSFAQPYLCHWCCTYLQYFPPPKWPILCRVGR